jgi:hypothetical protein
VCHGGIHALFIGDIDLNAIMESTLVGLLEPATTVAPLAAYPRAIAFPNPLVPPVTRHTFPEISKPL